MSALYDLYQPGESWLHRLDPRVKVIFALSVCAMLLTLRNVWFMAGMLVSLHLVLFSARITWSRIAWVWRMALPTMVMIALLWVLFYGGQGKPLLAWWFIRITAQNLAEGSAVALRIGAMAFAVFVWLFTTDQATLVHSLVKLGLPYSWGLTLAVSLRYLPTMANAFQMISDAQQARALDLHHGNPLKRARAYLPITVSMLITALRTAQNLAHALESRALGAVPQRTYLREFHPSWADWLIAVLILGATAWMLWARFAWGWCADPLRVL